MIKPIEQRIHGLYAVTPDCADTARLQALVQAALQGGARWLQYRNKRADTALRLAQARALRGLCDTHGARLIINDDVDTALAVRADGVHLGGDDLPLEAARERLGAHGVIGISCYGDLARARAAARGGADYAAFGSIHASPTKPGAHRVGTGVLARARAEITLPVVAIGGITLDNAGETVAAGADAIAVISALFEAPDVAAAARSLQHCFEPTYH